MTDFTIDHIRDASEKIQALSGTVRTGSADPRLRPWINPLVRNFADALRNEFLESVLDPDAQEAEHDRQLRFDDAVKLSAELDATNPGLSTAPCLAALQSDLQDATTRFDVLTAYADFAASLAAAINGHRPARPH